MLDSALGAKSEKNLEVHLPGELSAMLELRVGRGSARGWVWHPLAALVEAAAA